MVYYDKSLADLKIGESCMVKSIDDSLPIKNRLKEMGFYSQAIIDKLLVGPGGSPIAFRVCGAVLSLRKEDASKIYVEHIQ